ncbi:MAG: hypothetical protein AAF327_26015, partial [Cyanobacteria bacterium P01_A01_bin.37]
VVEAIAHGELPGNNIPTVRAHSCAPLRQSFLMPRGWFNCKSLTYCRDSPEMVHYASAFLDASWAIWNPTQSLYWSGVGCVRRSP